MGPAIESLEPWLLLAWWLDMATEGAAGGGKLTVGEEAAIGLWGGSSGSFGRRRRDKATADLLERL